MSKTFSAEIAGINARLIEVEIDLNVGLHAFNIVGLADKSLIESRDRINSALKNSGFKPPNRQNRKITVNLAPADLRKTGSQYDLAIAVGYLLATKQIDQFKTDKKIFAGELGLDGKLRTIRGSLNIADMASRERCEVLFLPRDNIGEASAITNMQIVGIASLQQLVQALESENYLKRLIQQPKLSVPAASSKHKKSPDISDVKGQANAKRALTIAAAGQHNLIISGSPGIGKSFLAQSIVNILPGLSRKEAIEVTKIWSAAGVRLNSLITQRPFRAPHQSSTPRAMIGGGTEMRPGEISLAHCGVLFLDEFPEFKKQTLEVLRGPMENGWISLARNKNRIVIPARFMLVATMNPCPCGFREEPGKECRCSVYEVARYKKRISGALLDRIDMRINIQRVPISSLRSMNNEKNLGDVHSKTIKEKVMLATERQRQRFKNENRGRVLRTNSDMTSAETEKMCHLSKDAKAFLKDLPPRCLSPRGYYRLLKTARTIADLEDNPSVSAKNLAEAWSYRPESRNMD